MSHAFRSGASAEHSESPVFHRTGHPGARVGEVEAAAQAPWECPVALEADRMLGLAFRVNWGQEGITWRNSWHVMEMAYVYCSGFRIAMGEGPSSVLSPLSVALFNPASDPLWMDWWISSCGAGRPGRVAGLHLGTVVRKLYLGKYRNSAEWLQDVREVLKGVEKACQFTELLTSSAPPDILPRKRTTAPDCETLTTEAWRLLRIVEAWAEAERLGNRFAYYERMLLEAFGGIELRLGTMQNILNQVIQDPRSAAFKKPVDHIAWNLEDYKLVVQRQMDLQTVQEHLLAGEYNVSDVKFAREVRQIWINAMSYNQKESTIYHDAEALAIDFELALRRDYKKAWRQAIITGKSTFRDREGVLHIWDQDSLTYYAEEFAGTAPEQHNAFKEKFEAWERDWAKTKYHRDWGSLQITDDVGLKREPFDRINGSPILVCCEGILENVDRPRPFGPVNQMTTAVDTHGGPSLG